MPTELKKILSLGDTVYIVPRDLRWNKPQLGEVTKVTAKKIFINHSPARYWDYDGFAIGSMGNGDYTIYKSEQDYLDLLAWKNAKYNISQFNNNNLSREQKMAISKIVTAKSVSLQNTNDAENSCIITTSTTEKHEMKNYLVITRHTALIEYLKEQQIIDDSAEIISHVSDPEIVKGRHVIGVLPHSISCLTASFSEVPLNLPAEKRGVELTIQDMHEYAGEMVTYQVTKI